MYDIILFFVPSAVQSSQTPTVVQGFVLGLISAVIINIVAACIGYVSQGKSKIRETANTSKDMLVYIHMVLCLQRSKLANLQKILEGRKVFDQNKLDLRKLVVTPLVINVKEEYLQKILAYSKFGKSKAYPSTFQCIVEAESTYQKCMMFVDQFNKSIDEDRLLNADGKKREVYIQIIDSELQGMKLSYEEAIVINNNARAKTIAIAKEVFGKVICQQ